MKNKEIQKILKKMNTEESEKIIAYIEKLEKEYDKEEKLNTRLLNTSKDLIEEREKVINYVKTSIESYCMMYEYEKREEEKRMISRKIRVFESILEKYKK